MNHIAQSGSSPEDLALYGYTLFGGIPTVVEDDCHGVSVRSRDLGFPLRLQLPEALLRLTPAIDPITRSCEPLLFLRCEPRPGHASMILQLPRLGAHAGAGSTM